MSNYSINNIYQGGPSSFSPSYGDVFSGYGVSAGSLGTHTSPATANQLSEVSKVLNTGAIPVELMTLDPKVFEAIPEEHFKEIGRAAKLAGAQISVHAPLIEPTGMDQQGRFVAGS